MLLEMLVGVAFREGPALLILLYFTDLPYCAADCEEAKALVWATCCSLPAAGNLFGTSMLYLRRRIQLPLRIPEAIKNPAEAKRGHGEKKRRDAETSCAEEMFIVAAESLNAFPSKRQAIFDWLAAKSSSSLEVISSVL